MKQTFQTGPDRYRPARSSDDAYAAVNQRGLAFVVGLAALSLPLVMLIGAINPVWRTCFRDSISHYYYAQFLGSFFIGALVFIGAYMLVYKGEDAGGAEKRLATWAGICAIGVAVFPTTGHGCDALAFESRALVDFAIPAGASDLILTIQDPISGYFDLFPLAATLHYISATLLFAFLAWFALFVFTSVEPHQRSADGSLTPAKATRNVIYVAAGYTMIACMAAMALYALLGWLMGADNPRLAFWNTLNLTFWFEAIALWAFGFSWMVKGRFLGKYLSDRAAP